MDILFAPASWLKACIYAGLLLAIYRGAFVWLVTKDWVRDDYTHCGLIPFAVVFLIWDRRKSLENIPAGPSSWGFIPLCAGVVLFWLGELGGEFFVIYFSFWLAVVGLTWVHIGWRKLKAVGFPILLIMAMFPLPNFVSSKISLQLRLISSRMGVALLQAAGLSAYREGNVIDIGFTQLQVADACSGLRYLIPLMILSLLIAYHFKDRLWKRMVVFLCSIPLAVAVNSLRIAVTGILYSYIGASAAEGFFHGFSGWLIFVLSFLFLLFVVVILRRLPPARLRSTMELRAVPFVTSSGRAAGMDALRHRERAFFKPAFIAAVTLLGATLALSQGTELRQKVDLIKPFSSFPVQINEWSGHREFLDREVTDEMHLTDYILADYKDSRQRQINFYVAYYDSQVKGESIHSPDTCLPGHGWLFQETGRKQIQLTEHPNMSILVNRAVIDNAGSKQLAYYWFLVRGRVLHSLYELKLYTFWDVLTTRRTDGALVRLITPVYTNESAQQSDERLQGFAGLVVPMLDEYIPGK